MNYPANQDVQFDTALSIFHPQIAQITQILYSREGV